MKTRSSNYSAINTLESLINKYSKQYKNIETFAIDNDIFITRPLTRKEFKEINGNAAISFTYHILFIYIRYTII